MKGRRWIGSSLTIGVFITVGIWKVSEPRWSHLTGETMGTNYQVHFKHTGLLGIRKIEVDIVTLFASVNMELSTWDERSWISDFNRAPAGAAMAVPHHAWTVLECGLRVADESGGAFSPASFPLLKLWGFGPNPAKNEWVPDPVDVEKCVQLSDHRNLVMERATRTITKRMEGVQIDCSALAKGYAVDKIAELLERRRLVDFSIEVGGEVRVSGSNPHGEDWSIRLKTPVDYASPVPVIKLNEYSIATSGGSQDFLTIGGIDYSHIIDARTGYPITKKDSVFSVSVVSETCMLADALATACFVLGPELSEQLIMRFPDSEIVCVVQENASKSIALSK